MVGRMLTVMMKHTGGPVGMVACLLLFVGGLNWGLVGFFNWNLVEAVLGSWPVVVRVVYALVGLSALYSLVMCKQCHVTKPAA